MRFEPVANLKPGLIPKTKNSNEHDVIQAPACGLVGRKAAQNPQADACATQSKVLWSYSLFR
jgi:hypothetical protein